MSKEYQMTAIRFVTLMFGLGSLWIIIIAILAIVSASSLFHGKPNGYALAALTLITAPIIIGAISLIISDRRWQAQHRKRLPT